MTPDDDATESRLSDGGCEMLDGSRDGVRSWMVHGHRHGCHIFVPAYFNSGYLDHDMI